MTKYRRENNIRRVEIMMSEDERDTLGRAAELSHQSVGAFMLSHALRAAKKTVADAAEPKGES